MMNDAIIRNSLLGFLKENKQDKNSILVSEMGLDGGSAIIDIALINGAMCGYEIKSDVDTLDRLRSQIPIYEKYFQYLTIVTTDKHLKNVREYLPNWVGIMLAEEHASGTSNINSVRKPRFNKNMSKDELTKLIWKNEAQSLLYTKGVKGISNVPRRILWERIAETTTEDQLIQEIKKFMNSRSSWQVVA